MPDRAPHPRADPLPDVTPATTAEIATLADRLTTDPVSPIEADTVARLLARHLKVVAAANRLLGLTGHALATQLRTAQLAVAEDELHVALVTRGPW